jgi:hypothetical protein
MGSIELMFSGIVMVFDAVRVLPEIINSFIIINQYVVRRNGKYYAGFIAGLFKMYKVRGHPLKGPLSMNKFPHSRKKHNFSLQGLICEWSSV